MQCCLLTTSSPLVAIKHILKNNALYSKAISSIRFSRTAREHCNKFSFCFTVPCDGSKILMEEHRILQIVDKPSTVVWKNSTEKTVGYTLLNAKFFSAVLNSFHEALNAKNKDKQYCKCFTIPMCLFPNIPLSQLQIRLSGKDIIDLFYN